MSKRGRQEKEKVGVATSIVRLNVGGELMATALSTLRARPESLLGRMFDPDGRYGELLRDDTDAVFLDADPEAFRVILNYLRRGRLVEHGCLPPILANKVRAEADYFGLDELVVDGGEDMCADSVAGAVKASAVALETLAEKFDDVIEKLGSVANSLDSVAGSSTEVSGSLDEIKETFEGIVAETQDSSYWPVRHVKGIRCIKFDGN